MLSSDNAQLALGGAAGGLAKGLTLQERLLQIGRNIVVGVICSLVFGKAGLAIFGPVAEKLLPANALSLITTGALLGMGGQQIVFLVLDLWRIKRKQIDKETA